MSEFWRKEYWTIKAVGEFGQDVGSLAHEGDFFEKVSGLRPVRRFASMVLAANEVTRWREMRHCGPGKSPSYKLVRHTVKTKPRSAKVGTWAWACEQMLAGKAVRRPEWGVRRMVSLASLHGFEQQLCVRTIRNDGWEPDVPRVSDFQATNWQVAL